MRAVVYTRYGSPDVLRLSELETPVPQDDEVVVQVTAVSLNRSDWEGLTGKPLYARLLGVFRPRRKVLGSDVAGRVVAVGPRATRWRPGDEVFADTIDRLGGLAEFVCLPEGLLARLPEGMSHEEAAALPQAGAIAVQGILEKGLVREGQRVLVNGAGGGSGMFAVQLAKLQGAEVTGVDNAWKLEFVRSLGADHVVDYEQEDYAGARAAYDLILDLAATRSVFAVRRALRPGGQYLFVGGSVATLLQVLLLGPLLRRKGKRVRLLVVRQGVAHLGPLVELCRSGGVTVHIDRRFPLAAGPDALRYFGAGRARGKVVVVPEPPRTP